MSAAITTSSVLLLLCAAAFFTVTTYATDVEHQGKPQYKTGDLVMNSCANMRVHDWIPQLTRKQCESTLRSHKKSAVAKDERDLTLIAMDLLQSSATKVDDVLRQHSASGSLSKSATLAIRYCRLDYEAVARIVPMCRAMIQEYKPVYGDPNAGDDFYDCIARVGNAAGSCLGHVLVDDELAKVVSKEVGEVFQRATLVRAMVEVMIGFRHDSS